MKKEIEMQLTTILNIFNEHFEFQISVCFLCFKSKN